METRTKVVTGEHELNAVLRENEGRRKLIEVTSMHPTRGSSQLITTLIVPEDVVLITLHDEIIKAPTKGAKLHNRKVMNLHLISTEAYSLFFIDEVSRKQLYDILTAVM